MDAMLLAAGRGERMRPLSDHCPKPLLAVAGRPLIVWQIEALARAGMRRLVINHAWLGDQLVAALGDGRTLGVQIRWSPEVRALGTAGGIAQALTLLEGPCFAVVSADIHTDFDYAALPALGARLAPHDDLAHLVLVDDHRVRQDFDLHDGRVCCTASPSLTYGNIGVFQRALFDGLMPGLAADLGQRLRVAVAEGRVSGQVHRGRWDNVGCPADLRRVNDAAVSLSNPHESLPES
jgi:MurNAc alpha-1-phosphate uridylyltransferase